MKARVKKDMFLIYCSLIFEVFLHCILYRISRTLINCWQPTKIHGCMMYLCSRMILIKHKTFMQFDIKFPCPKCCRGSSPGNDTQHSNYFCACNLRKIMSTMTVLPQLPTIQIHLPYTCTMTYRASSFSLLTFLLHSPEWTCLDKTQSTKLTIQWLNIYSTSKHFSQ